MLREPVVAGQFYPGGRDELSGEVRTLLGGDSQRSECCGAVVPHAGYMYSGKTAGAVYSRIIPTPAVIILGPNHTGMGGSASVWARGAWKTPLGEAHVDEALADRMISKSRLLKADFSAHLAEHSIEVQLPFLQELNESVRIVPAAFKDLPPDECAEVSDSIASAVSGHDCPVSILASSDMSHYEHEKAARAKDALAIEAMLAMDEEELYRVVRSEHISMCGFIPAVILIGAVKKLGARKAELIEYTTSARETGDYSSVVGYCGVIFR